MADYYLCSGKLIKPNRDGLPTNIKVGDMQYWTDFFTGKSDIYVVKQAYSASSHYIWRNATHEEACLMKTHILLNP